MVRLHEIRAAGAARPHEVPGAQLVQRRARGRRVLEPRRLLRHALRDRAARDGDRVEEPPRVLGKPLDAGADDAVERYVRARDRRDLQVVGVGLRMQRELADEERAAVRLPRHRGGARACRRVGRLLAREERERELLRLRTGERADEDAAVRERGLAVRQLAQKRARPRLVRAMRPHEEDGRRAGRRQDLLHEEGAVLVPPLEIVHVQDDSPFLDEPREELPQRREREAPQLLLVRDLEGARLHVRYRVDAPERREHARELVHAARQEPERLGARQTAQVAAEGVDDAVEGLERHRFALVAPAGEDDRLVRFPHVAEEALHERRLPHAARAVDVHGDRPASARLLERRSQLGELRLAAHERRRAGGGSAVGHGHRLPLGRRERERHVATRRALVGLPLQERDGERVQILGDAVNEGAGRDRVAELLGHEHLERRPVEGVLPGEHDVQHHPDRVPVRRGRELPTRGLLRRHVRGRAREVVLLVRGDRVGPLVLHQAKIEDRHAAFVRDEHVGRLQIAVELAGVMERRHAADKLRERGPEARDVEHARDRVRRGGRLQRLWLHPVQRRDMRVLRTGPLAEGRFDVGRRDGGDRLAGDRLRVGLGGLVANVPVEVHALHELHGDEPLVAGGYQLVEADQVRVAHVRQRAKLLLQAVDAGGVDPRQRLERDALATLLVERLIHDAHPSGAQPPLDGEALGSPEVWSRPARPGGRRPHETWTDVCTGRHHFPYTRLYLGNST